jgi:hypothetical protein
MFGRIQEEKELLKRKQEVYVNFEAVKIIAFCEANIRKI